MSSSAEQPLTLNKDVAFILYVRVHIPASKHGDFFNYFNPAFDKVMKEPEMRFFIVQKQDQNSPNYDPDVITWVEGWSKDAGWLQTEQMGKEYYEPYRSETAKMYSKPIEYEFWSPEEGMCQFKMPIA